MRDIRTITVDLDDTLWSTNPVIGRAERGLYEWLGSEYPKITEMFTPAAMLDVRREVIGEYPARHYDFTFLRRTVLGRLGIAAGYGDGLVDDAMAVFSALRNDVELFPEVRPTLAALRKDYCVIAVTNGNADVDAIGIRDLFHEVISASAAGAAKPDRKIFEIAVNAGRATAAQTLHVGDHPEIDVVGALDAGLKSVWINRDDDEWPDHLRPPDGVVKDLGELLAMLGFDEQ